MDEIKILEEKMAENQKQQEEISQKIQGLHEERGKLDRQLDKLKVQYVLKSGLISEQAWKIDEFDLRKIRLTSQIRKHSKFSKLLQKDYHCSIKFDEGIILYFDDEDICFSFDSMEKGLDFIKKWKIKTNIDALRGKKEGMEKELNNLRSYIEIFNKGTGSE